MADMAKFRITLTSLVSGEFLRARPFNELMDGLIKAGDEETVLDYMAEYLFKEPEALAEMFFALRPDLMVKVANGLEKRAKGILDPMWEVEGKKYCLAVSAAQDLSNRNGIPYSWRSHDESVTWRYLGRLEEDLITLQMAHQKTRILHFLSFPDMDDPKAVFGYYKEGRDSPHEYVWGELNHLSHRGVLEFRNGVDQTLPLCLDFVADELRKWPQKYRRVHLPSTGYPSHQKRYFSITDEAKIRGRFMAILQDQRNRKSRGWSRGALLKPWFFHQHTHPLVEGDADLLGRVIEEMRGQLEEVDVEIHWPPKDEHV